jgi:hypothetical protein
MTDNRKTRPHEAAYDPALSENLDEPDESQTSGQFDNPGSDGVVTEQETDPDRRDLRAEIGKYVSLVRFPITTDELTAGVQANNAPDTVVNELRRIAPGTSLANTRELWEALGLDISERF